ncbi:hypothetical protein [Nocardia acidivorans]|nr:hypothetical protein [Nocardia acidivorans]
MSLRLIGMLGGLTPTLTAAIQRGLGAEQIARQLAEGQRYKN